MNVLFLTLLFPLIGWFILAFSRGRLSEGVAAVIGVGASKHWHDGGAEPPVHRVGCRVDRP